MEKQGRWGCFEHYMECYSLLLGSAIGYDCFISTVWQKYSLFLQFSVNGFYGWGIIGYLLGTSRKRTLIVCCATAFCLGWVCHGNKESARIEVRALSYGFFQWSRETDASETEYRIPFNLY